jgi:hypothetical protein
MYPTLASTLTLVAALTSTPPLLVLAQSTQHKQAERTESKSSADEADTPLVPFPHPLITEVLFAVPTGETDGDADQSGTRSATGDEFIELINPHTKPINLKGYRLVDGQPIAGPGSRDTRATGGGGNKTQQEKDPRRGMGAKKSVGPEDMPYSKNKEKSSGPAEPKVAKPTTSVRGRTNDRSRLDFTFPELVLHPGETVVVFNGYKSEPAGTNESLVGTSKKAADKNGSFHGAFVLSMRCTSMYQALSNREDMIVLLASDGKVVDTIRWGPTNDDGTPTPKDKRSPVRGKGGMEEWVPSNCLGSVQRTSQTAAGGGGFACHIDLNGELASPGEVQPMSVREHADSSAARPETPEEDEQPQPAEETADQAPQTTPEPATQSPADPSSEPAEPTQAEPNPK